MLQKDWIISLVTIPVPSFLSICKKFIQLNNYHKLYTKHPDVTIDNWEGSRRIIIWLERRMKEKLSWGIQSQNVLKLKIMSPGGIG